MGFGDGSFIPNEKERLQTLPQKELQWWQVDGLRGLSLCNELKAEKKKIMFDLQIVISVIEYQPLDSLSADMWVCKLELWTV